MMVDGIEARTPLIPVAAVRTASLLRYDTGRYPFAKVTAATVFKVRSLERLHEAWQRHRERQGQDTAPTYADNLALRALMQNLPDASPLFQLYHRFVRQVIAPVFGGRISYSNRPKMRVHLPDTGSVSAWHRDADVTGRYDQITVWLPFTDCREGGTLWSETDYGLRDFRPIDVAYGEALVFDGGLLEHGTVANDAGMTRVSLDFRFAVTGDILPDTAKAILGQRPTHMVPQD
ncbi:streptomycin biosynthesis enzyme StrG [Azospirillum lipoferum]|uniref:Streptomycin biosynthesis enzyme StrG n=1 Tax=Azospirillum lipoferum (strain 4B) TaxID=862719 RepID=G7ZCF1_AZOL4|nr:streptomycin biosynthesis enzyme StrG [Azospirillum lipoferum]CBS89319.1 Putative streptomycin biosynthesis enzyme StrG [Azospirillum lipoferum 4B]